MMNNQDIANLKGTSLKAKAVELDIPGRSKMNADELRVAIVNHYAEENTPVAKEPVTKEHAWVPDFIARRNADSLRQATSNALGSASPMSTERRTDVYQTQNVSLRLTPKQARRLRKKNNKNFSA